MENEIHRPVNSIVLYGLKNVPKSKLDDRTKLPPHKFLLLQTDQKLIADTMQKSLLSAKDQSGITDTPHIAANDNIIKEKTSKNILGKWKPGFTVYGGVSDNVEGLKIVSAKSFLAANQSGQSGLSSFQSNTSGNSVSSASPLQYKNGASFGAGVYVQKRLTRKLNAIVGVDYHYMSARSLVGNKVNSTLNLYDSLLQKSTIVNPYYRAGQTTSFSNKYHLVQLPINLQLQLNKNIDKPLLFAFGLAPSILITTNALYLNSNARAYYREKEQFNHVILFGQSELLYTLSNRQKYQLNIGPALQYDFNSISKTPTNTRQHFIFSGLKTSITLK